MTQIVQEQQWQTWNRTHWSINIHSVVNLQIMSLRFLFTAVLFVACVRCFARSWQDKFVSVQSEDSQFSPQFGVAAEHGCESRRVTADLIWLFASDAAEALIVLCVCQELYVCVRGERERESTKSTLSLVKAASWQRVIRHCHVLCIFTVALDWMEGLPLISATWTKGQIPLKEAV